ncbi:MAG: hypothetical protein OEY79_02465 [Anaplasmataceae bacterium]|nr:hypothetical protein [Anaplasmataceae bacterium]
MDFILSQDQANVLGDEFEMDISGKPYFYYRCDYRIRPEIWDIADFNFFKG